MFETHDDVHRLLKSPCPWSLPCTDTSEQWFNTSCQQHTYPNLQVRGFSQLQVAQPLDLYSLPTECWKDVSIEWILNRGLNDQKCHTLIWGQILSLTFYLFLIFTLGHVIHLPFILHQPQAKWTDIYCYYLSSQKVPIFHFWSTLNIFVWHQPWLMTKNS